MLHNDWLWSQFRPKRVEPNFHPQVAPPEFVLALAERISGLHELLCQRVEKASPLVLTEADYCPLG